VRSASQFPTELTSNRFKQSHDLRSISHSLRKFLPTAFKTSARSSLGTSVSDASLYEEGLRTRTLRRCRQKAIRTARYWTMPNMLILINQSSTADRTRGSEELGAARISDESFCAKSEASYSIKFRVCCAFRNSRSTRISKVRHPRSCSRGVPEVVSRSDIHAANLASPRPYS